MGRKYKKYSTTPCLGQLFGWLGGGGEVKLISQVNLKWKLERNRFLHERNERTGGKMLIFFLKRKDKNSIEFSPPKKKKEIGERVGICWSGRGRQVCVWEKLFFFLFFHKKTFLV